MTGRRSRGHKAVTAESHLEAGQQLPQTHGRLGQAKTERSSEKVGAGPHA